MCIQECCAYEDVAMQMQIIIYFCPVYIYQGLLSFFTCPVYVGLGCSTQAKHTLRKCYYFGLHTLRSIPHSQTFRPGNIKKLQPIYIHIYIYKHYLKKMCVNLLFVWGGFELTGLILMHHYYKSVIDQLGLPLTYPNN